MRRNDEMARDGIEQVRAELEESAERLFAGHTARRSLNRRTFVLGSLATGAMWTTDVTAQTPVASPVASVDLTENPFTLGVASGDPEPDGVVLWTRLAPFPFEADGGMPGASVELTYEIAGDEGMSDIVQQGTAVAEVEWAHSVHMEVSGLEPDRWYYYRFRIGGYDSPVGRTRTAPEAGASFENLRFAFASCQRFEDGLFTAFRDLAEQDVDLVVHLGDYIYEYTMQADRMPRELDLPFNGLSETRTLEDYRQRHALYKLDPHLQEAHRMAPWVVTWDDHEVSNNYIVPVVEDTLFGDSLKERREAAYRAYYEHQPLRAASRPDGVDMPLYRVAEFGDLVRFNVLDTRQYRYPAAGGCNDSERERNDGFCEAVLNPERTMLGAEQKDWLLDGFGETTARWSVLANQVPFARIDFDSGPGQSFGGSDNDKWDGYALERDEVLVAMADAAEQQGFNPVVITGDVHANYVWDLKRDWDAPEGESIVGTEFVGTSIASNGDDPLKEDGGFTTRCGGLRGNTHNHLSDNHRGYVLCDLTPDQWRATFRVMPTVEDPDATASTLASFVVEHGRPGAQADETCTPEG